VGKCFEKQQRVGLKTRFSCKWTRLTDCAQQGHIACRFNNLAIIPDHIVQQINIKAAVLSLMREDREVSLR